MQKNQHQSDCCVCVAFVSYYQVQYRGLVYRPPSTVRWAVLRLMGSVDDDDDVSVLLSLYDASALVSLQAGSTRYLLVHRVSICVSPPDPAPCLGC